MIDWTLRWLVFLAAMMGLWRTEGRGAEPLPPLAWARIGDHRFYHGPGITCVALSPDGRHTAPAAREHNADEIADKGASLYDRLLVVWDAGTVLLGCVEKQASFASPRTAKGLGGCLLGSEHRWPTVPRPLARGWETCA